MKHKTLTSRTLLAFALLGALAVAPTMTRVAHADAPDVAARADRDFGRDNNDDRANAGRHNKAEGRDKVGRRGNADGRADNGPRSGRADTGNRGRNRDNTLGSNRNGRFDNSPITAPQFVGVVSKVKSDSEFDIRVGDKTYNVYLAASARRVSVGQTVQLNGERIGTNDIRSASLLQPRRR